MMQAMVLEEFGGPEVLHMAAVERPQAAPTVVPTMSNYANQERQLNGLVDAIAAGRIQAPEIDIMPLDQAGEAHRRVAGGHVRGKILLAVDTSLYVGDCR